MERHKSLDTAIENFQNRFGIEFNEKGFLELAFNNGPPVRRKNKSAQESNAARVTRKTLSALGDAALQLLSIESELDRRTSVKFQRNSHLSRRFDSLDFQQYLQTICRSKDTKGNAIEAVLGAIYLDQGLGSAKIFYMDAIVAA